MKKKREKFFIKVAGVRTERTVRTPEAAVVTLKQAAPLYETLRHSRLVKLLEHYPQDSLYVAVFRWTEGECLFDHWNFDAYEKDGWERSPWRRFHSLPAGKKRAAFEAVLAFMEHAEAKGFAAADFYDGSVIYDFSRDIPTFCDIDLFRPLPATNDVGPDYPGSKRFKAPEEYRPGAAIDSTTNVHALGAFAFHFFGDYAKADIDRMYQDSAFHPCPPEKWLLSEEAYGVALKSVAPERSARFRSTAEFAAAWRNAKQ